MDMIWWAALLLSIGFCLALLEMFVPTGGILGVISTISIVAAIGLAFSRGSWYGMTFLTGTLAGLPLLFVLIVQIWPKTSLGRRILPHLPKGQEVLPDNELRRGLRDLVGRVGQTQSPMLPSGSILVNGRPIDAISEGMAIGAGEMVRIVEVRGTRVVVRPTNERPPTDPLQDPLSRSFETGEQGPIEDPFA